MLSAAGLLIQYIHTVPNKKSRGKLGSLVLFCIVNGSVFADNINLDLSGIVKLVFNFVCNISCNDNHLVVADNLGFNNDTYLTTCLNSERVFNTAKGIGDFLKFFKTLDIAFDIFSSGTGTGSRNSVGSLYDASDNGLCFNLTVMGVDSVNNIFAFLILLSHFNTELNVSSLLLVVYSLTNIVEKTCAFCKGNVLAKLCCNYT